MTVKVLIFPFLVFVVNISENQQMTLRKEEHVNFRWTYSKLVDSTVNPSALQEIRVALCFLQFN